MPTNSTGSPTSPAWRPTAMGVGLAVLNRVAGLSVLDRWGVRRPAERAVYHSTKTGFRTAGAVNRTFHKMRASGAAARPSAAPGTGVFDLDPTEDQQMMVQVVRDFAADVLSPAAARARSSDRTIE